MRFSAAILLFFANLGTAFVAAPALAQDAVPETPPELRDFRLDQPREQAPPQPAPQQTAPQEPSVTPPEARTPPETARPAPSPVRQRPQEAIPQSPDAASSRSDASAPDQEVAPVIEPEATDDSSVAPQPNLDQAPVPPPATERATVWNLPLLIGILVALLMLGLLGYILRRRRRDNWPSVEADASGEIAEPAPSQSIPASPPAKVNQDPVLPPAMATAPVTSQKSAQTGGDISILFVPEKATISFTNLTVQGQLQIANVGKLPARDMQLRAVLVSASSEQQRAIDSFFADPAQIAPNALGETKPGERLGLSLELSVPLSEMQTFPVGEQLLLVPILVASLSYAQDDGEKFTANLACMIGREAQPPKPKMGPLRIDKGPRSFAPLGQRPVYT